MSWEAMERRSGLLVLILVLVLVLEPFLLRFFLNKRGRGRRRERNIEALDQFSQHRRDPKEQLLAFVDLSSAANALRDQRIQTRCAFSCRTTRIIEEPRSRSSLASAVSFRRIEQSGNTGSIKLIHNVRDSSIGTALLDLREQRGHPSDKAKF